MDLDDVKINFNKNKNTIIPASVGLLVFSIILFTIYMTEYGERLGDNKKNAVIVNMLLMLVCSGAIVGYSTGMLGKDDLYNFGD